MTIAQAQLKASILSVVSESVSMSVSMTIVSKTMAVVSQTMTIVSKTMSIVSQTGVSVSVVRISLSISLSLRLSLRLPLVQSVDSLERVSSRVELADSVSVSEVPQTMDVVETKTNCVSDDNTNTGFSISAPLAKTLRRPGHKGSGNSWMESNTGSVSVSVERSSQVSVSVERISLGFSLPLVDDVYSSRRTAAIAGGIQTQCPCSGPCGRYTTRAYQGIGVNCRDYS